MIPERSPAGKSAKSVFFEDQNDIDIYIEDTAYGYEKIFTILFQRLLNGKYRVRKTFPLGGRSNVIDHHKKRETRGRATLHIIDGDLFLLVGDQVSSSPGLFKLPFYCIENLLCDPSAIVEIMDEEEPILNQQEVLDEINIAEWTLKNEDLIFNLFVEYAISFLLNKEEQTVAYPISNLISSNSGDLDPSKVIARIDMLREKSVKASSKKEYEKKKEEIESNFHKNPIQKLEIASGKDILFPLLKMRCKSVIKTKASDINIKIRLAKKCDLSKISNAASFIIR